MNTLVAIFTELLTALNQSLRLSASFPALVLVAANAVLVQRYFKSSLFDPLFSNSPPIGIVVYLALTLMIAFALSSLNGPIVKWFEGHSLRSSWPGRWLTEANVERLHWLRYEKRRLHGRIRECIDHLDEDRTHRKFLRSAIDLGNVVAEMRAYFPTKEHLVMPTRLGNVIAAFEEYPSWRYGMDAVALWPRLVPTLKEVGYASVVERYKTAFDFFLNIALISILFGLELVYTIAYFEGRVPVIEFGTAILLACIFYRFTIAVAVNWGETVRVAFDLFRDDLRAALHLRRSSSYDQEVGLWRRYSAFLRNPEAKPGKDDFTYDKGPWVW